MSAIYTKETETQVRFQPAPSLYKKELKSQSIIFSQDVENGLRQAKNLAERVMTGTSLNTSNTNTFYTNRVISSLLDLFNQGVRITVNGLRAYHHYQPQMQVVLTDKRSTNIKKENRTSEEIAAEEKAAIERRNRAVSLVSASALALFSFLLGKDMNEREDYSTEIESVKEFKTDLLDPIQKDEEGEKNTHFRSIKKITNSWEKITKRILSQKFSTIVEKIGLLAGATLLFTGALLSSNPILITGSLVEMGSVCASVYTWARSSSYKSLNERESEQLKRQIETLLDSKQTTRPDTRLLTLNEVPKPILTLLFPTQINPVKNSSLTTTVNSSNVPLKKESGGTSSLPTKPALPHSLIQGIQAKGKRAKTHSTESSLQVTTTPVNTRRSLPQGIAQGIQAKGKTAKTHSSGSSLQVTTTPLNTRRSLPQGIAQGIQAKGKRAKTHSSGSSLQVTSSPVNTRRSLPQGIAQGIQERKRGDQLNGVQQGIHSQVKEGVKASFKSRGSKSVSLLEQIQKKANTFSKRRNLKQGVNSPSDNKKNKNPQDNSLMGQLGRELDKRRNSIAGSTTLLTPSQEGNGSESEWDE